MTAVISILLLGSLSSTALAASYPTIYPDEYSVTVTQGEKAEIKFTIFHEFKNEHAYIKVHEGSRTGPVVATADSSFYNVNPMTEWTVTWDTSDVEPGDYVVEYYMTFYSLYSWHETPSHSYLLTIHVNAAPCKNGHTYDAGTVTTAATCTRSGTKTFTCTTCKQTRTESIPTTEHSWNAGTVTKAQTVTAEGTKTFTCTTCKMTRTETIPAIFTDVPAGEFFAPAVEWAYNTKITAGTGTNTFSPDSTCTRGQVVTFLWRANGCPEPKATSSNFTDVKESDYFYKPVLWAVESGITAGTSKTTFSPQNPCSNAHILTFLWNSKGKPDYTGNGEWYSDAVAWASLYNLTEDTPAAQEVNSPCPRGNVVTFLYRVYDESANAALKHKYGDWKVVKAATCTSAGSETRTCVDCNFNQTRATPKAEHKYSAATCTTAQTCSVCKQTTGTAKGHTWNSATCSAPQTCTVCGTKEGNVLPHSYKNGVCTVCSAKNPNHVKQNLVYKDSRVIIKFKEITEKGVVFEVENLTNIEITIQADAISINKVSTEDIIMSDHVAPGSIGDVVARCDDFTPDTPVGIMSGTLRIIDFDDSFDTYSATFSNVVIDSDVQVKEPPVPNTLLYSDQRVRIYYKGLSDKGVVFTIQNLTDVNITIQANSVSLNKRSTDDIIMSDDVAPHSTGDVTARCTPPVSTDIQTVGGVLRVIDFDDSFDTYSAVFTNIPVK